jgi:hypothetical protein
MADRSGESGVTHTELAGMAGCGATMNPRRHRNVGFRAKAKIPSVADMKARSRQTATDPISVIQDQIANYRTPSH